MYPRKVTLFFFKMKVSYYRNRQESIVTICTRITYEKYQVSSTHCWKVKDKLFKYEAQLQGQGQRGKCGYSRKVLVTRIIHVKYQFSSRHAQKLLARLNVQTDLLNQFLYYFICIIIIVLNFKTARWSKATLCL